MAGSRHLDQGTSSATASTARARDSIGHGLAHRRTASANEDHDQVPKRINAVDANSIAVVVVLIAAAEAAGDEEAASPRLRLPSLKKPTSDP